MIVRCPNCLVGHRHTETTCRKCKTALPPVRVQDFVGHGRREVWDGRRTLAHAYFLARMGGDNHTALEISAATKLIEAACAALKKLEVPNDSNERRR